MKKGQTLPNGSSLKGPRKPRAKLKEDQIPEIRDFLKSGKSLMRVAVKFGVCKGVIQGISEGKRRRHV